MRQVFDLVIMSFMGQHQFGDPACRVFATGPEDTEVWDSPEVSASGSLFPVPGGCCQVFGVGLTSGHSLCPLSHYSLCCC